MEAADGLIPAQRADKLSESGGIDLRWISRNASASISPGAGDGLAVRGGSRVTPSQPSHCALAVVPIALGHTAAVAAVLAGVLAIGRMLDATMLLRLAAIVLIGWALWHTLHHSTSA